jgi:hypothetical protein
MVVLAALTDVDMLFADPVVLMSTFTTVEALWPFHFKQVLVTC